MVLQQWTNDFQGLSPEQDGQESLSCRESKPGHCQNKCCINVDHAETLIKEHLQIISRKDMFPRSKSCWFETTSGWVNDNRISDFRRTIHLSVWRSSVILADRVERQRLPRVALSTFSFFTGIKKKKIQFHSFFWEGESAVQTNTWGKGH